jgi:hypothetical protein
LNVLLFKIFGKLVFIFWVSCFRVFKLYSYIIFRNSRRLTTITRKKNFILSKHLVSMPFQYFTEYIRWNILVNHKELILVSKKLVNRIKFFFNKKIVKALVLFLSLVNKLWLLRLSWRSLSLFEKVEFKAIKIYIYFPLAFWCLLNLVLE